MRKLAALLWALGLSLRKAQIVLSALGMRLSHMSVWRDMQEQATLLAKRRRKPVRMLGVDGVYPSLRGKKRPILVAADPGDGKPLAMGEVDESDPGAVKRFPAPLVAELGVEAMVTDDLTGCRTGAKEPGLKHQVCPFHVRRWACRALRALRETIPGEKGVGVCLNDGNRFLRGILGRDGDLRL